MPHRHTHTNTRTYTCFLYCYFDCCCCSLHLLIDYTHTHTGSQPHTQTHIHTYAHLRIVLFDFDVFGIWLALGPHTKTALGSQHGPRNDTQTLLAVGGCHLAWLLPIVGGQAERAATKWPQNEHGHVSELTDFSLAAGQGTSRGQSRSNGSYHKRCR